MKVLGELNGEGFACSIVQDDDGRVEFVADADIDADGANGQSGARAAYMLYNAGSELLGNGGMTMRGNKVVGAADWFRDIVILGPGGQPREFPGGIIASKTAYRFHAKDRDDPATYVDSETVPYIVVPPLIIQRTAGAVLGCHCAATDLRTGTCVTGIVADVGPRTKTGELSIAMARALGIPSSPRTGGVEKPVIKYELWPGRHGEVKGERIALQRSNGTYILPA